MENGMWCSASSWTASRSSLAGTSGIWTRLMMRSRPETPMVALLARTPAFSTAVLMALTTTGGSLMAPSAIASGGSGAMDGGELPPGALLLELNDLHGARADVQAECFR